jgi:hypothetical protein
VARRATTRVRARTRTAEHGRERAVPRVGSARDDDDQRVRGDGASQSCRVPSDPVDRRWDPGDDDVAGLEHLGETSGDVAHPDDLHVVADAELRDPGTGLDRVDVGHDDALRLRLPGHARGDLEREPRTPQAGGSQVVARHHDHDALRREVLTGTAHEHRDGRGGHDLIDHRAEESLAGVRVPLPAHHQAGPGALRERVQHAAAGRGVDAHGRLDLGARGQRDPLRGVGEPPVRTQLLLP